MRELRRDPVTGRWVCLAPGRALRPEGVAGIASQADSNVEGCPFCEGHEDRTPPEVAAVRPEGGEADSPGWRVRVVPNLFPAFSDEEVEADLGNILHAHGPALGVCEVIIHSPDHHRWLPFLSAGQAALVGVTTWERYRRHSIPGVGSVVALYNHGRQAGASLPHPHGQLYATRLAAPALEEELRGAEDSHHRLGGCVFCRMADEEVAQQIRLVSQAEEFVALAPYASRQPFECLIIPRRHEADFGRADEDDAAALGVFLREVLWRLTREIGNTPLNWYIHGLPNATGDWQDSYHWHVELRPKLTEIASFEMATGTFINTLPPEIAAAALAVHPVPGPESSDPA